MLTKENIHSLSNTEIIQSLGVQYKSYRLNANLTQKEVAEKAGVSLITLRAFETGKATNITMGNLLALLRAINNLECITEILPEIPISPYQLLKAVIRISPTLCLVNQILSVDFKPQQ